MPMLETDFLLYYGVLFLLYAEIHYKFKGIYSRLKITEPEIVADVPHRLEPGQALPVLLLIKDADKYPVWVERVRVDICGAERGTRSFRFEPRCQVSQAFWHRVFEITDLGDCQGSCRVDVVIEIRIGHQIRIVRNDNYVGTSHAPFEVWIAEHPLPRFDGWRFGEFHCHTNYTSDQVEFGAPISATARLASAIGLDFFCATDHSYDLDDEPDNYLKNDPGLKKWLTLQQEVAQFNASHAEFVILPGEEVSAGNHRRRNVHFLILNNPEFLPGDGDSAEKWFRTRPSLTIPEILARITSESLAFAAHPAVKPPFLEWLLVRRAKWTLQDCIHPRLNGLQVWNGTEKGLAEGLQLWQDLLLSGRRLYIAGGNDAHGNFNRFRQIGLPFFTMRESREHLFGKVRTAVYSPESWSLTDLLNGIRKGRMVVTDGPFLQVTAGEGSGKTVHCGDELSSRHVKLLVEGLSSPEFGPLWRLQIYCGDFGARRETLLKSTTSFTHSFHHREELELTLPAHGGYVRGELFSGNNKRVYRCFTNPIWLKRA